MLEDVNASASSIHTNEPNLLESTLATSAKETSLKARARRRPIRAPKIAPKPRERHQVNLIPWKRHAASRDKANAAAAAAEQVAKSLGLKRQPERFMGIVRRHKTFAQMQMDASARISLAQHFPSLQLNLEPRPDAFLHKLKRTDFKKELDTVKQAMLDGSPASTEARIGLKIPRAERIQWMLERTREHREHAQEMMGQEQDWREVLDLRRMQTSARSATGKEPPNFADSQEDSMQEVPVQEQDDQDYDGDSEGEVGDGGDEQALPILKSAQSRELLRTHSGLAILLTDPPQASAVETSTLEQPPASESNLQELVQAKRTMEEIVESMRKQRLEDAVEPAPQSSKYSQPIGALQIDEGNMVLPRRYMDVAGQHLTGLQYVSQPSLVPKEVIPLRVTSPKDQKATTWRVMHKFGYEVQ